MSQYNPNQQYPGAYSGQAQSSAMAITALVLGIIPGLGLVGFILGIVALARANRNPERFGGKGFAIAGIVAGAITTFLALPVVLLMVAILIPSLGRARAMANRSTCAANLRGIMQSMVVYSADNNETYPYISSVPTRKTAGKEILGSPAVPPTTPGDGGLMYSMYSLAGSGMVAPKQFICKSDPAKITPSLAPTPSPAYPGYTPTYWTSSSGGNPNLTYSYSFAWQYSAPTQLGAWWRNTMDAGAPIAADLNPGSQKARSSSANFNSLNHEGDGQNIAFADAHAEFLRTPAAGEFVGGGADNIYNLGSSNPSAPGTLGSAIAFPDPSGNVQGTFDTWLLPALTNSSTYDRQ